MAPTREPTMRTEIAMRADPLTDDPAHHGANGAAMPTDEDDQDGHFFFNHPERADYPAA